MVDGLVLTGTYDGRVIALDSTTGTTRADRFLAGPITSTPAVTGDTVIWQAGTGGNARVFALTLEGSGLSSPNPTETPTVAGNETTTGENGTATAIPTETPITIVTVSTETNGTMGITAAEGYSAGTFAPAVPGETKAPP